MKLLLNLLTTLLITTLACGQNMEEKIDAIIQEHYQNNPEVSISVGFMHNDVEYYTAYGKINKESEVDVDKNTVFEIASITKILTANLIAQAAIEGKLQLDAYIESYLPKEYELHPSIINTIKISDLASHQSGLVDIDFGKLIAKNAQNPMEEVTRKTFIDLVNNCTSLTDYGHYRYSTMGYILLGEILESVYGKSYEEIVREKLIQPLKLKNTLTKEFDVDNIAMGYNGKGGIQNPFPWSAAASAGLIKSSSLDMIAYLKALLEDETVIAKAAMITEKLFYKEKEGLRKLGLGVNIYTDDKNTYYLKTGDTMGQSSVICYSRAHNWGFIVLINQQNPKMRKQLYATIYEKVLK